MSEIVENYNNEYKLCKNMNCQRFPPDWNPEEDTKENYLEDQWKKCVLCIGYFDDDGMGDVLFIEEEPNNRRGECNLCGKTNNIVQMKSTGEYLCENACDESDEDDDESDEDDDESDVDDEENDKDDEESNEEVNKCDECHIELNETRDGSTDKNFRCNNCYWEDKEGKNSNFIIKPDYRKNMEENDRYVLCNNCSYEIDCWNCNIYCLYKGKYKTPSEEITICQFCNDDLREEFEEDGYKCDDWEE